MREAAVLPGHVWGLEVLICMLLYLAGTIVVSIGQVPGLMAYLLQNETYQQMVRSGQMDIDRIIKLMQDAPEWFTIFVLFTEIFVLFIYMLYCRLVEKRKASTMGFLGEGGLGQYGKGLVIGIAAFTSAYLLCLVTGSVRFGGVNEQMVPGYIVLYFAGYMIQGMAEEVICRGYFMVSLTRKYSMWFSAVLSSLLFMILHFANDGMTVRSMLNLFLFGIFMALLFVDCGNIWVIGALHSVWNFMQGNVFGIQVSGLPKQNAIFVSVFQEGRDWIHGGSFGLEGGLAVTLVLLICIRWVYAHMESKGLLLEEEDVVLVPSESSGKEVETSEEKENAPLKEYSSFQEIFEVQEQESGKKPKGPEQTVFDADYFREDG